MMGIFPLPTYSLSAEQYESILIHAAHGVRLLKKAQIYYLPETKTIRVVNPCRTLARRFKNDIGAWVGNYEWPFDKTCFSEDLDALFVELGGV